MKTRLDRIAKETNFFLKNFLKKKNNSKLHYEIKKKN